VAGESPAEDRVGLRRREEVAAAAAALRIANTSVSAGWGSTNTSAAPTASPVSTIPLGSP